MLHFDIDGPEFQENPWPLYAHFRKHDPVHWSEKDGCFYLFKFTHIRNVLRSEDFSATHPLRASRQAMGATILDLENEDHQRLRGLLAPRFTITALEMYRKEIVEPVVNELLDEVSKKEDVDFISDFAVPLPLRVTAKLLGVPGGDCTWVHNQLRPILQFLDDSHYGLETAVTARAALLEYLRDLTSRCNDGRRTNLLTYLMTAHKTRDALTYDEVLQAGMLILAAATETTIGAIANTLFALCIHPGAWDSVRADMSSIGRIVQETLRWEPPLHGTVRFAAKNIRFEGILIRKATPVILMLGSANRDEAHFRVPDSWNPHRSERDLLSFGFGRHMCLGFGLAQRELEVAVRLIVKRLPALSLGDGDQPGIQGRFFRRPPSLKLRFAPLEQQEAGAQGSGRRTQNLSRIFHCQPESQKLECLRDSAAAADSARREAKVDEQ